MEPFDAEGIFWHPDRADVEIPGTLSLGSDGLRLKLYAPLMPMLDDHAYRYPERVDDPVLHGRLRGVRGEEVTCLNVSGWTVLGPFSSGSDEFHVGAVLRGGHASSERLTSATVRFDHLSGWAPLPAVVTSRRGKRVTLRTDSQVLATASRLDLTFTLRALRLTSTHLAGARVDQEVVIDIDGPETGLDDLLQTRVRPLQDFLMICIGRPVALTGLSINSADPSLPPYPLDVTFDALQRPPADLDRTWNTRLSASPSLYLLDDHHAPFAEVLPAWLEAHEKYRDVVQRLLSSFYAPFTYSENRLASMYQAAEAFAKATLPTTQLTTYQVRTKVRPVIKLLREAGWAKDDYERVRKVLSRNDKTLNDLFSDLLAESGAIGQALASIDGIPGDWTYARTGASHGGAEHLAGLRTYWLAQGLWWLMRSRLLQVAGVPAAVLDARVLAKSDFQSVLHELGSVVAGKPEVAAVEGSSVTYEKQ